MHRVEIGSGTPLLLIHGFCVDHRILLGLDPLFAAQGHWRRVYIDLPGMGASTAGRLIRSADDVAAEVLAFARESFGTQPFAVLGNSFGAMIARHLVAELGQQVIGLALLCPVAVANKSARLLPPRTVMHRDPELLASLDPQDASAYEEMSVLQTPANWARFRDSVLPGLRAFDRAAVGRIAGRYALAREPEGYAPRFTGPTLMISGRQDHVVGFEDQLALAQHYPNATVSVLENAGHNAHLDQPEATGALICKWLSSLKAPVRYSEPSTN